MKRGFVYILTNRPDGTLYIGATADLAKRVEQHRSGQGSGFTRKYQCHTLVWFEHHENIHDARRTERRMKAWKRAWKIRLIEEANPGWADLSNTLF